MLWFLAACVSPPVSTPDPVVDSDEPDTDVPESYAWTDGSDTATVDVEDLTSDERRYTFTTTASLPEGPQTRVVDELVGPRLRSGSPVLDGLFALALEETRQLSVSEISDGAFDNGQPLPCDCFQTGEKWTYVWTRDTAYAADLALAWVDPERTWNSLDFKLSEDKNGGTLQIVQDTGTGGSWPVSTDRVVWALGARRTLNFLPADHPAHDRVAEALANTLDQDRAHVWDERDGLYRGEQSFLDWREQSYPPWTAEQPAHIAMSKSLSTNVAHWIALDLAGRDAEADALATAIEAFWDDGYRAMVPSEWTGLAHQREWLGTSLLVQEGLGTQERREQSVASYPHSAAGPPVFWPQQPDVPIYHNRAIWPFVTAYGLRAAKTVDNPAVFAAGARSLVDGAAIHLSNMENYEFLTGDPWVDDGDLSGPVVNSRRQLWSVAGYLSMVVDGWIGLEDSPDGLVFAPYLPAELRDWFGDTLVLEGFPYRDATFDIAITLPDEGVGAYVIAEVRLDGVVVDGPITADTGDHLVEITLEPGSGSGTLTPVIQDGDPDRWMAPVTPVITDVRRENGIVVEWSSGHPADVYRNGERIAEDQSGSFTDTSSGTETPCYTVVAENTRGLRSQPAEPVCQWDDRVQIVGIHDLVNDGGTWSDAHGRLHHQDWGAPDHTLTAYDIRPNWTGPHLLQLVHGTGGSLTTGITAAHKWVTVDGPGLQEGPVVLPQLGSWDVWRDSTVLPLTLDAGETYTITVSDAPNMSELDHFTSYTGGAGGGPDPFNFTNITEVKLLPLDGVDETPTTGALLGFDGTDDLGKHDPGQVDVPGVPLQDWERFALSWDADWLYLTLVSEAFEDPYRAWVVYLGTDDTPSPGMSYSGLTPELPFTPTHAVLVRQQSDDGSGSGPYNGVFEGSARRNRFEPGVTEFLATDLHTMSVRVRRDLLGDATTVRLASHVVYGVTGEEYKDTVPADHTPWASGGGAHYQIDLDDDPAVSSWTLVP